MLALCIHVVLTLHARSTNTVHTHSASTVHARSTIAVHAHSANTMHAHSDYTVLESFLLVLSRTRFICISVSTY